MKVADHCSTCKASPRAVGIELKCVPVTLLSIFEYLIRGSTVRPADHDIFEVYKVKLSVFPLVHLMFNFFQMPRLISVTIEGHVNETGKSENETLF